MIWDLAGDDDFQRLQTSYLRGTSGYLLVADGTRRITFEQVLEIQRRVVEALPAAPFIFALNKADLAAAMGGDGGGYRSTNWTRLDNDADERERRRWGGGSFHRPRADDDFGEVALGLTNELHLEEPWRILTRPPMPCCTRSASCSSVASHPALSARSGECRRG